MTIITAWSVIGVDAFLLILLVRSMFPYLKAQRQKYKWRVAEIEKEFRQKEAAIEELRRREIVNCTFWVRLPEKWLEEMWGLSEEEAYDGFLLNRPYEEISWLWM